MWTPCLAIYYTPTARGKQSWVVLQIMLIIDIEIIALHLYSIGYVLILDRDIDNYIQVAIITIKYLKYIVIWLNLASEISFKSYWFLFVLTLLSSYSNGVFSLFSKVVLPLTVEEVSKEQLHFLTNDKFFRYLHSIIYISGFVLFIGLMFIFVMRFPLD